MVIFRLQFFSILIRSSSIVIFNTSCSLLFLFTYEVIFLYLFGRLLLRLNHLSGNIQLSIGSKGEEHSKLHRILTALYPFIRVTESNKSNINGYYKKVSNYDSRQQETQLITK